MSIPYSAMHTFANGSNPPRADSQRGYQVSDLTPRDRAGCVFRG